MKILNYLKFLSENNATEIEKLLKMHDSFCLTAPIRGVANESIIYKGTSNLWLIAHYDKITDYRSFRGSEMPYFYNKEEDPLKFEIEGDCITGNLDNSISVAFLLLLHEKYPQHNYVFTMGEEVGFLGAREVNKMIPRDAIVINFDISDDCFLNDISKVPVIYLYQNMLDDVKKAFTKRGSVIYTARGNDAFSIHNKKAVISFHTQIENMHTTNEEKTSLKHIEECFKLIDSVLKEESFE